jgi:hypothetical protein
VGEKTATAYIFVNFRQNIVKIYCHLNIYLTDMPSGLPDPQNPLKYGVSFTKKADVTGVMRHTFPKLLMPYPL